MFAHSNINLTTNLTRKALFIEVVETNSDRPDSNFTRFHLNTSFKQYLSHHDRCFTDDFIDDDDFEHTDRLPKKQLMIEAKILLNLNISSG